LQFDDGALHSAAPTPTERNDAAATIRSSFCSSSDDDVDVDDVTVLVVEMSLMVVKILLLLAYCLLVAFLSLYKRNFCAVYDRNKYDM